MALNVTCKVSSKICYCHFFWLMSYVNKINQSSISKLSYKSSNLHLKNCPVTFKILSCELRNYVTNAQTIKCNLYFMSTHTKYKKQLFLWFTCCSFRQYMFGMILWIIMIIGVFINNYQEINPANLDTAATE